MQPKKKTSPQTAGYKIDGIQVAADLLNSLDHETQERLLKNIEQKDAQIVEKIKSQMFTFEDLASLEPKEIQQLIREAPHKILVLALRDTSEEVKNIIFKNMSVRAAQNLKEDIEMQGPQRKSAIHAAQVEILKTAQKQKVGT